MSHAQIETWLHWQRAGEGRHFGDSIGITFSPNLWCASYTCVKEGEKKCQVCWIKQDMYLYEKGVKKSGREGKKWEGGIKVERWEVKLKGKTWRKRGEREKGKEWERKKSRADGEIHKAPWPPSVSDKVDALSHSSELNGLEKIWMKWEPEGITGHPVKNSTETSKQLY